MTKQYFYGTSRNWSDVRPRTLETNNHEGAMNFEESVEAGDGGAQTESLLSRVNAEQILLKLLTNLDDRGKIILMFQIMRGSGFDLTQEDCAKTLGYATKYYIGLAKEVKDRCIKIATEGAV
jgi:hypothetical protein